MSIYQIIDHKQLKMFTNEPWGNGFCLKYGYKCDNFVLLVPSVKAKALIVI